MIYEEGIVEAGSIAREDAGMLEATADVRQSRGSMVMERHLRILSFGVEKA